MLEPAVIVSKQGSVGFLTLNNPPMNPIGVAQVMALEQLLPVLAADKSVRAIVIKGESIDEGEATHFSVGANLQEAHIAEEVGPNKFVEQRIQLFNQIATMEKPIIAAIQGYCLGVVWSWPWRAIFA
nr:enoyl-CoA hydratase/isomerase family protein [Oceanicoccus sp. KOV_DT_Chl]